MTFYEFMRDHVRFMQYQVGYGGNISQFIICVHGSGKVFSNISLLEACKKAALFLDPELRITN